MDFFTFSPVWCDLSRNLFVKLYGFLYSLDNSDQKGGEKIGKKITASGMLLYEKRKLES